MPFAYRLASSPTDAVALASEPGARYLGGGTNLVDLMKLGVEVPEILVDVSRLDLTGIEEGPDGGLEIGAAVRNSDLAASPAVRARYAVLSEALLAGASGQLRNMATVGGNLLQRTRCRYFQDISKPCNKRSPGSGCPAVAGEHHNLAILGTMDDETTCVATHPSDMAVAVLALDAVVHLWGPDGARDLLVDDLYRLPANHPERDTNLQPGELITGLAIPAAGAHRSAYIKVRERASFAFALVSVGVSATLDDGGARVARIRLALGGVAHRPWRCHRAEAALAGTSTGPGFAARVASAIDVELAVARPLRDNGYKIRLARNLVVDSVLQVCSQ